MDVPDDNYNPLACKETLLRTNQGEITSACIMASPATLTRQTNLDALAHYLKNTARMRVQFHTHMA
eukprot:1404802-Lingulodinium_polyedra.AAC.1